MVIAADPKFGDGGGGAPVIAQQIKQQDEVLVAGEQNSVGRDGTWLIEFV